MGLRYMRSVKKKEKRLKGKITENPPELSQTIKELRWKEKRMWFRQHTEKSWRNKSGKNPPNRREARQSERSNSMRVCYVRHSVQVLPLRQHLQQNKTWGWPSVSVRFSSASITWVAAIYSSSIDGLVGKVNTCAAPVNWSCSGFQLCRLDDE